VEGVMKTVRVEVLAVQPVPVPVPEPDPEPLPMEEEPAVDGPVVGVVVGEIGEIEGETTETVDTEALGDTGVVGVTGVVGDKGVVGGGSGEVKVEDPEM